MKAAILKLHLKLLHNVAKYVAASIKYFVLLIDDFYHNRMSDSLNEKPNLFVAEWHFHIECVYQTPSKLTHSISSLCNFLTLKHDRTTKRTNGVDDEMSQFSLKSVQL